MQYFFLLWKIKKENRRDALVEGGGKERYLTTWNRFIQLLH